MNKIIDNYTLAFKNFANTSGRSNRAEYWYFYLANFLIIIALVILSTIINDDKGLLSSIYNLVIFIPTISLSIRRLHDLDKSGWMLLIVFIPIIGSIWFLILMAKAGTTEDNQYGSAAMVENTNLDAVTNPLSTPEVNNTQVPQDTTQNT